MQRRNNSDDTTTPDYLGPPNPSYAIFLISVLGLFLEMLFIRWIGTEVRIFAYLQNTILVACFLGLGLGCFTCRQPIDLRKMLISLFVLLMLFAIPISRQGLGRISELLGAWGDLLIWRAPTVPDLKTTLFFLVAGLIGTYVLMVLILDTFVPIGRLLGRLMDDHPHTILAYSVNVAGSIVGTWLFVLLSVFFLPPVAWFLVFGLLLTFFVDWSKSSRTINLALVLGLIVLSWFAGKEWGALEVVWSPYQKLVLKERTAENQGFVSYIITVNNLNYQAMIDLSDAQTRANPERFPPEMVGFSQYGLPFLLHPNPFSCLIVGAGSGNDAAAALRHGVKKITAVEIDPAIISMGKRYHPEQPYDSDAVFLVNDDARSFFAFCPEKYDVISFGFLDSHTTTSLTNSRLDHYVYTQESIARVKTLLAGEGILVLGFAPERLFIVDRLAGVLKEVFGEDPLIIPIPPRFGSGVLFISGHLETARQQIARNPALAKFIQTQQESFPISLSYSTLVATDDWPYIYLDSPRIPFLYYTLAGLLVLLLWRSYRQWHGVGLISRWTRSHWHFFFLGAAFLLLEVQNISKASVALGNTWEVNAVIISGVMIMILLANLVAYKFPSLPLSLIYTLLISTCLSLYLVDLSRFAFLSYFSKAVIIGGLTTLPMLFSGIVFIRSFTVVPGKDEALGANLIGALVGALLQSVTFITGIKALLLIVAALYFLSLLTRPILATDKA